MVGTILRNLLVLTSLGVLALGIVWLFFRIFVPLRPEGRGVKWRTPAAAGGFFALYTALVGIYVPLINREPPAVLVQETEYGSVELDVNRLFEYSDSNRKVGVPSGYFAAADTSFYLEPPDHTFWLTEADTLPSFRDALAIQQVDVELKLGNLLNILLGVPSYDAPDVRRYCAAEAGSRQLIYTEESEVNGRRITFNPMNDKRYWRWIAERMVIGMRTVVAESLHDELPNEEDITDREIDELMANVNSVWSVRPSVPRQYLFRNTFCVLSFGPENLRLGLEEALDLPRQNLHLMRFGKALQSIVPSFDLGGLRDIVTSRGGEVLLARDPITLRRVMLDGTRHEQLAVEQVYLLAVSQERAYFVQVQFMIAPGQDLTTWRQLQGTLRSLRFVAER